MTPFVEHGGSWRPFWIVAAAVAAFVGLEIALPGRDLPWSGWSALVVVLGIVGIGCLSARRMWTVRVDGLGPDAVLAVGRERVPLSQIDVDHLRAVDSGVDAGAPVLGGGWSLPRGRTGLPLKFTDGRTVLVPTRDPAPLYEALVVRVTDTAVDTPGEAPGSQGTLGS
ncbi:hypothetical protein [Blastococcus goldschmidtiae]|uniref:DUF3093 domain-containing protein n=1 Tax=Blastococcus goldschmidtiae TaxID=3075546 RepID=A0ABU2K3U6_9ACTN|nr:hypothetical protein [Blastococcus sp. DSM 46792]MDT0274859.1 hypothetical protein [Blastococcus sp. DSM 46792]